MAKQAKRVKPEQLALPGFDPVHRKPWSAAGCLDLPKRQYQPEYNSWHGMIQRCQNPSAPSFSNYGGKGVKVCPEWRRSFGAFVRDMGRRPDGTTLDRIDPARDYEPANCRWLGASENFRRGAGSSSRKPVAGFVSYCAASQSLGGCRGFVSGRRRRGWCEEHAATLPKGARRPADCAHCNANGGA